MMKLDLLAGFLFMLAGLGIYLIILNRIVINFKDGPVKVILALTALLAFTSLPALYGYYVGWPDGFLAATAMLLLLILGEIRRLHIKGKSTGSPPVESTGSTENLSSPLTTPSFAVHRFEVRIPGFSGGRMRIGLVSDMHVNNLLPDEHYTGAFDKLADYQPDVVAMAGDYISRDKYLPKLERILPAARKFKRAYAILGNHDYWADYKRIAEMIEGNDVELIGGGCVKVESPKGEGGLILCGCEGPWGEKCSPPAEKEHGYATVVLTHTPDNIFRFSEQKVDVVLAGHYHAGQVRMPFYGPLVIPSIYGRRFDHGHFVIDRTNLFITAGVGSHNPPFRIYCIPDVFVIDIISGD